MFARLAVLLGAAVALAACATPDPKDYTAFHDASPRSILIVPVINHSNEVEAADLFLTTLPVPLAERGFYVFPTNMVKQLIENDGLADAGLVHATDTTQLAALFNADSVLYVEILDWKSQYALVSANIVVHFLYTLKDGKTGVLLWQDERQYVHSRGGGSGNIFADMIASAIVSATDSMRSDYTPVALSANAMALLSDGQGIPFGPYSPNSGENTQKFPSTGTGRISNATEVAVSYPQGAKPADTADTADDSGDGGGATQ